MASDFGDGLNFDMTNPEVTMPKPELKIPMAPDAKFELAAVCLNWVSMYFGINVQYPIKPNMKNELLAVLNTSILFVKIRFKDVLKSVEICSVFSSSCFSLRAAALGSTLGKNIIIIEKTMHEIPMGVHPIHQAPIHLGSSLVMVGVR